MVLFPGFETIDAMGPVEMLGYLEGETTRWVSLSGGVVTSAQGVPVMTEKMDDDAPEILLIPGAAPQWLKLEPAFFDAIRRAAEKAQYVLTVCTGSFLLARTGFLNGRKATSNKNAIPMVFEGPLEEEGPLGGGRERVDIVGHHRRDGHGFGVHREDPE